MSSKKICNSRNTIVYVGINRVMVTWARYLNGGQVSIFKDGSVGKQGKFLNDKTVFNNKQVLKDTEKKWTSMENRQKVGKLKEGTDSLKDRQKGGQC